MFKTKPTVPYIQQVHGGWVVVTDNKPVQLKAIAAIGAFKESIKLGYDVDRRVYVDLEGKVNLVLFKVG